jgi:Transposase DDE domain
VPPIIPISRQFDQSTLGKIIDADPVVQRYRARFALFDWSAIDPPRKRGPGSPAHPKSAYLKAALVRISEHHLTTPRWRAYLLDHPLLVLELGFRPHVDLTQPYGFDVAKTVPSVRHLNNILRSLDPRLLADLFAQSVQGLQAEIPGLGEVVAFDVKHIYANVKANNFRAYVPERFNKQQQPTGDPDCRLGVKTSTNQEHPDGSTTEKKELLWGYGSGVAAATDPVYGDVVLADFTLPFNENDVTYFVPLYIQTVAMLGAFPLHITADAAFDAWYAYQTCARRSGIAAIPLNQHAHPVFVRDGDGTPRCPIGLRMHPTYQFQHTNGYRAQRYRCPLLYPAPTGQTCDHEQFHKDKGCVKDINLEAGGLMRVTLDRESPLYKVIYNQRTCSERINSQAQALGIERPKARNLRSVRTLNTLIYLTINIKALGRAQQVNASLLTTKQGLVA